MDQYLRRLYEAFVSFGFGPSAVFVQNALSLFVESGSMPFGAQSVKYFSRTLH
jgi:hypothetical protein